MAKLSYVSNYLVFVSLTFLSRVVERKRRQVYRGEVHGQLPFDPKGMDDAVPSIDFSPSGGRDTDNPYTLERADINSTLRILNLRRMSDLSGMS
jgi:autophagy-related protein 11